MNAVIAVFNSLSVRGRSRYTADFAAEVHSDFPKALYFNLMVPPSYMRSVVDRNVVVRRIAV
jgi:hypothetical protein